MGHQVGCYLSFAQVEQLDDLADAAGKCRSALLRDVIADFLKEPTEAEKQHSEHLKIQVEWASQLREQGIDPYPGLETAMKNL